MASDFSLRQLQIWEIPKLIKFKERNDYKAPSEPRGHSESLVHAFLKALWYGERMVTFIAEDRENILGYLNLIFGRQTKFKGNAYIVSVAVDSRARGKGIGTALLQQAEKLSRGRGARRLELEVFARNTGAIDLYKRLGYDVEGVKRHAVENGNQYDDLVFMAKLLN